MASVKSANIFSMENGAALSQKAPPQGKKTGLLHFDIFKCYRKSGQDIFTSLHF